MLEDTPQKVWPHAAIIGLPPRQHGSTRKDEDAELILSMAGVSLFVEKPLGAFAPAAGDPAGAAAVGAILASLAADKKLLTAVSYPLRYSRAVESLRKRLFDSGKRPTCVMARFNYAYSGASPFEGLDGRGASGIVFRHAADLLDLCRLIMGEVDLDTIQALAVPAQQQSGTPGLLDGTKEPPPQQTSLLPPHGASALGPWGPSPSPPSSTAVDPAPSWRCGPTASGSCSWIPTPPTPSSRYDCRRKRSTPPRSSHRSSCRRARTLPRPPAIRILIL
eukprot:TRINITY_DN2887_c0_g1_i1.p1 TRINITY_DN2887_c0_g1~~TRINITY_DN2887_c0_g1_i1.p1  ORF type:complete len:277 (+),score=31.48 TRINITY_DN2887_c0_g1_i1:171-1001(+)